MESLIPVSASHVRRTRPPLVWLVVFSCLLCVAYVVVSAAGFGTQLKERVTPSTQPMEAPAQNELKFPSHFWWPDAQHTAGLQVEIKAPPSQRDVILGVTTSCGCAVAKASATDVQPNDRVTIPIDVNIAGRSGLHRFHMFVQFQQAGVQRYALNVPCYPAAAFVPAEYTIHDASVQTGEGLLILRGKEPALIPVLQELIGDDALIVTNHGRMILQENDNDPELSKAGYRFSWHWADNKQSALNLANVTAIVQNPADGGVHRIYCPIRRDAAPDYTVVPRRLFLKTSRDASEVVQRLVDVSRSDGFEFEIDDCQSSHTAIRAQPESQGSQATHRVMIRIEPTLLTATALSDVSVRCHTAEHGAGMVRIPVSVFFAQ